MYLILISSKRLCLRLDYRIKQLFVSNHSLTLENEEQNPHYAHANSAFGHKHTQTQIMLRRPGKIGGGPDASTVPSSTMKQTNTSSSFPSIFEHDGTVEDQTNESDAVMPAPIHTHKRPRACPRLFLMHA